jgi:hypothetical protein
VDDGSDETSIDRKTFDAIKDDPAFVVDIKNNTVTWDLTRLQTTLLSQGWNRIRVLAEIADPLSGNQWTEGLAIASTTFLIPPFALEFAEYDVVKIEFPGYPSQTVTFTGMFRFIFWKKYEYLSAVSQETDFLHALLTELKIRSTTPLYIPGVGSTFLEIVRDPAEFTFGELDLKQNKLFWELKALVRLVDTSIEPVPIRFLIEDAWSRSKRGICLKATGAGVIDPDVPIFGGATFHLNPGSGCSQEKDKEKAKQKIPAEQEGLYEYLQTTKEILKQVKETKALKAAITMVDTALKIIKQQEFTRKDAINSCHYLEKIFRDIHLGTMPDTNIMAFLEWMDEHGIPLPLTPTKEKIAAAIGTALQEKYKGPEGKEEAGNIADKLRDLIQNLKEEER